MPRLYRDKMGNARLVSFRLQSGETDIWIAVNRDEYSDKLKSFVSGRINYYRKTIMEHIGKHPGFLTSLVPLKSSEGAEIINDMYKASAIAGTGPMAAVAGAIAEFVCRDTVSEFNLSGISAENGGDVFLMLTEQSVISVYAGDSPLSEKIGLLVGESQTPISVCCSSGTVGHSLSFGKADACVISCKSGALADAYATACCNEVKNADMIQTVTEKYCAKPGIESVIIIAGDKVSVGGQMEIKLLR